MIRIKDDGWKGIFKALVLVALFTLVGIYLTVPLKYIGNFLIILGLYQFIATYIDTRKNQDGLH